jgi:hypothetical protein
MKNEIRFGAPWAVIVKVMTVVALTLYVGTSAVGLFVLPVTTPYFARLLMVVTPVVLLATSLPFMVRGYVLREDELLIERLGWMNRVPLSSVESLVADPKALQGSIRLCGSAGLYGFFGWFRNAKLGVYRAYGTDPARSVVIKLTGRTIVVTPDDPGRFVAEVVSRQSAGRK